LQVFLYENLKTSLHLNMQTYAYFTTLESDSPINRTKFLSVYQCL